MDPITGLPIIDYTPPALLGLVVLLVLTDKLIWHKRLRRVEDERDRWQQTALRALGVADKLTVQGEVTTALVASLPDPAARQDT